MLSRALLWLFGIITHEADGRAVVITTVFDIRNPSISWFTLIYS